MPVTWHVPIRPESLHLYIFILLFYYHTKQRAVVVSQSMNPIMLQKNYYVVFSEYRNKITKVESDKVKKEQLNAETLQSHLKY